MNYVSFNSMSKKFYFLTLLLLSNKIFLGYFISNFYLVSSTLILIFIWLDQFVVVNEIFSVTIALIDLIELMSEMEWCLTLDINFFIPFLTLIIDPYGCETNFIELKYFHGTKD